jgi:hypothetical protein
MPRRAGHRSASITQTSRRELDDPSPARQRGSRSHDIVGGMGLFSSSTVPGRGVPQHVHPLDELELVAPDELALLTR